MSETLNLILQVYLSGIKTTLSSFLDVAPFFLPFAILFFAGELWVQYLRSLNISKMEWVLLEAKLPKEIFKSPKAMEVALGALHQSGPAGNIWEKWWLGKLTPWFSLELVSIGGAIHFFIRTEKKYLSTIESAFYSQYPDVEMHEVPDYVEKVPFGRKDCPWDVWGVEFKLSKDDALPIKTYIDYGLGDDPKEEFKVDPMTPTLELLGSIRQDQQIWVQILVRMTEKRFPKPGSFVWYKPSTWSEMQDWKDNAGDLLKKLMKRDKKEGAASLELLSPGERTVVESLERSISKLGFDCGIRILYLHKFESFKNKSLTNILGILSTFKQYNTLNLNGFKIARSTYYEWWQDLFGKKIVRDKAETFEAYVRRGWFYPPHARVPFVLNTEELATVYHFPGIVAQTPTIGRIESKRGEAPVDLPI